ncbi:hypothetical protein F5887DRAFT_1077568 [Amanita rubescens]|nr:hypothetical protein F5887DRAFT_1077568 [Amanita rubescens]
MPNNGDANPSTDSIGVQTRRNWWHKAKDFIIRNCWMYDLGDNARLNLSESYIYAGVVVVIQRMERLISSTSHVEQGGTQGLSDDIGPGCEEPPVTLGQLRTPASTPGDPGGAFKSDAITKYTNPDVPIPSNSSASDQFTAFYLITPHIYSLEMMIHGAGYPLHIPTPSKSRSLQAAYRKKGVRVGDVGVITANGAFDFLFNACKPDDPSDAGVNPAILPDGFELLDKPFIMAHDKFDAGICLHSTHDIYESVSRPTAFQCSTKGAILALPTGATVYEARNTLHFQMHAARHAVSWYKYALNEGGRDISNGSLYFVTECTKTKNWGIAVFYASTEANNDQRAIFDKESCRWEYRGKVDAKVGPKPTDIILSDDEEPNQCVFLRGFKIMLRSDIWDKLSAVGVTCQDGESSSLPSTRTTTHSPGHEMSGSGSDSFGRSASDDCNTSESSNNEGLQAFQLTQTEVLQAIPTKVADAFGKPHSRLGQVILEEKFKETVPLHPSDPINVMLLHMKPEAMVALVHDDVCKKSSLLEDFMEDPINPNIDGLLEIVRWSYKPAIYQHGNGTY